jgi:hypothetical protein
MLGDVLATRAILKRDNGHAARTVRIPVILRTVPDLQNLICLSVIKRNLRLRLITRKGDNCVISF